jgi:hypothetical protein
MASVAASVMKPAPATPEAPMEVSMAMARIQDGDSCSAVSGVAWA